MYSDLDCMRTAKFNYSISHVPGRLLFTADALYRDSIPEHEPSILQKEIEVLAHVNSLSRYFHHQSNNWRCTIKRKSEMKCVHRYENTAR